MKSKYHWRASERANGQKIGSENWCLAENWGFPEISFPGSLETTKSASWKLTNIKSRRNMYSGVHLITIAHGRCFKRQCRRSQKKKHFTQNMSNIPEAPWIATHELCTQKKTLLSRQSPHRRVSWSVYPALRKGGVKCHTNFWTPCRCPGTLYQTIKTNIMHLYLCKLEGLSHFIQIW